MCFRSLFPGGCIEVFLRSYFPLVGLDAFFASSPAFEVEWSKELNLFFERSFVVLFKMDSSRVR